MRVLCITLRITISLTWKHRHTWIVRGCRNFSLTCMASTFLSFLHFLYTRLRRYTVWYLTSTQELWYLLAAWSEIATKVDVTMPHSRRTDRSSPSCRTSVPSLGLEAHTYLAYQFGSDSLGEILFLEVSQWATPRETYNTRGLRYSKSSILDAVLMSRTFSMWPTGWERGKVLLSCLMLMMERRMGGQEHWPHCWNHTNGVTPFRINYIRVQKTQSRTIDSVAMKFQQNRSLVNNKNNQLRETFETNENVPLQLCSSIQ